MRLCEETVGLRSLNIVDAEAEIVGFGDGTRMDLFRL